MTIGYPDWQRYAARVGANLLPSDDMTIPPGSHVYGPFAMAGWGGMSLTSLPYQGYATVRADWWETSAMASSVKYDEWAVNTDFDLLVTMPAWGPWMSVTVDVTSAADLKTVTSARGLASAGPSLTYPVTGGGIDEDGVILAASSSATYYSPFIRSGQAFVSFNPYDSTGNLHLAVIELGADLSLKSTIAYLGAPAATSTWLMTVPGTALGVRVTNVDASATHEFDLRVSFP